MTKSKYITTHDFGVFTVEHTRLTKKEPKVKVEWNKDDIKEAISHCVDKKDKKFSQIYDEVIYPMKYPCPKEMVKECLDEMVRDALVKKYEFKTVCETVYYI